MTPLCLYLHMVLFAFQNFTKWNCKLGRNLPLASLGSERVNDHFITSHNLISWQGRDIVGRKLMLVTIGTWRVNANFNTFTLNSLNEKYPFRKKMPAILQHKAFSGLPTFSFHNFHVNSAVKSVNNKSTERPNFCQPNKLACWALLTLPLPGWINWRVA